MQTKRVLHFWSLAQLRKAGKRSKREDSHSAYRSLPACEEMLIHMNSVQWLRLLRIPETVYRQSHAKRTQSLPCIQPCTTYHAAKKKV
jgi:hypothetical protein